MPFVAETTGNLQYFKVEEVLEARLGAVFLTLLLYHAALLYFMEAVVINAQTFKNKLEEKSHPTVAPALGSDVFK